MDDLLFNSVYAGFSEWMLGKFPSAASHVFLVALSGGADSVALLKLMVRLREDHPFALMAAHVHHGLRGENADLDERFCAFICEEWRVSLIRKRAMNLQEGAGLEEKARNVRYLLLKEAYRECGAEALVMAHHANDQAETLLMRLMRGSGAGGLGGIRGDTVRDGIRIVRPLLLLPRALIEALGIVHREDESNLTADNLRNILRLRVMPELEHIMPGAAARMARTAAIAACEDDYMNEISARMIDGHAYIGVERLEGLHPAVLRRVLRMFTGLALDAATSFKLERLIRSKPGTKVNLPSGFTAERGYRYLFLPDKVRPVKPIADTEPWIPSHGFGDGRRTQVMPAGCYKRSEWRYWQKGDMICPFGQTGHKSLQDYFTDMKVDRPFRAIIPLLCRDHEVMWAPGLGVSESARAAAHDNVMLTAGHDMPWLTDDAYISDKGAEQHGNDIRAI